MLLPTHRRQPRSAVLALACALFLLALPGCKNQEDAEAAAAQMATTAGVLRDYYNALDLVLARTEDAYQVQYVDTGVPGEKLTETREQIRHRAAMAEEIGDLADVFQKLTHSTAASDASAAAGKLNDEAFSLAGLSGNDAEANAVTLGIREIVSLIQQHEEKKAAARLEPLCDHLVALFASEEHAYDSLIEAYLGTARSNAQYLVRQNQVDFSSVYLSSLHPFRLAPAISENAIKQAMQPYLLAQIDRDYDLRLRRARESTQALDTCLKEMDSRIRLVAHQESMPFRREPFSLTLVTGWIAQITQPADTPASAK